MSNDNAYIPYEALTFPMDEMHLKSKEWYALLDKRRTVRAFSDKPVPKEVVENVVMAASTAPSGAHKQPWTFCLVSNPEVKKQIREGAEKEEYENYHGRMSDKWLRELRPFATDWHKPFLETAPWLIVIFKRVYELVDGQKANNYYVNESVGIAVGFLLAGLHNVGLVALTHTPSPMNFLSKILSRPENERPFLLIPTGYPADRVTVPNIRRKGAEQVIEWYE